jgi:hypothetical protein
MFQGFKTKSGTLEPWEDRRTVIRDCKKSLNARIAEEESLMEEDVQHWKSEVSKDQQAVADQEIVVRNEWQRMKELEMSLNRQRSGKPDVSIP